MPVKYPKNCKPFNASTKNTELLKRLKILCEVLKGEVTNEEAGSPNRYKDLMLHLTDSQFLSNKNSDIQLLLACSIADLFRVFAPNSPIENSILLKVIKKAWFSYLRKTKERTADIVVSYSNAFWMDLLINCDEQDVLLFIATAIGNVPNKGSSMYQYYLYFIENISVIETMQVALELGDNAYVILRQLIKQSLNSVNEKSADEHIQGMLVGMCSKLIQGVDQISNIVLDAIFFFIVQPQKMNNREAYLMARDLIRTNQTALEPYVALLLKRGLEMGILDECELISPKKLYDLICELHKLAPEMISSLLPTLVNQMHSDDVAVRREAVRLFGNLFGDKNSRMAEDEPEVWSEYMKRFVDVNEGIRRICIKNAEDIIVFHPELRGQMTEAIILRSQDVDENVRLEVLTMVQGLAKRKFEALSEELLTHVIDRIRDKKIRVRHAVIRGLSHLHRTIFSNDELTSLEHSSVSSIFSAIMNHYYKPLLEDRLLTEKVFVSSLVPYKLDADKRMGILVDIFLNMNSYGVKALEQILMKQSFQRRLLRNLVKLIEQSVEPQKGKTIDDIIRGIVECNPEPAKFSLVFRQFITHLTNDRQILSSLKYITSKECTCEKVEAAVLEILQRLRDHKVSVECLDAVRCLFECCSPLQFDRMAVSVLVDKVIRLIKEDIDGNHVNRGHKLIKLLKIVADAYPHCFVNGSALEGLVELIEIANFPETEGLLGVLIAISTELKQNEILAKNVIDKYVKRCESITLNGTPRAAKYAVRCISRLLNIEQARAKLGSIFQDSLSHISASDPQCCTALKTLSSCVEVDAVQFYNELLDILKTKIMDLLLDRSSDNIFTQQDSADSFREQFDNEIFDENYIEIKKHCLKFVANFLVSVAQFSECDVESIAKSLLRLYSTLLETKGDIFEKSCSRAHMAEFRILAGSSMLKLATKPRYAKFVTADDLVTLSTLAYEEEPEIRHRFFGKLNKHLIALQLHVEYMGLFALVTLHEDPDFQSKIRVLVDANIRKRRKYLEKSQIKVFAPYYQPEYCLAYAIYILAKLPSFESIKCQTELRRLTESIWFLLEIFSARKEPGSLEFIYNIFKTVKNSTDSKLQDCSREELQQKNEKIWALCDIGILLMSYRVKILMKNVESKPLLSKRFYLSMGKADNTKVYVPASFVKEMKKNKANTKHQKTDTTRGRAKSLIQSSWANNREQSARFSNVRKVNKKRAISKDRINSSYKSQTNNSSHKDQTSFLNNENDVFKYPEIVCEEEKQEQLKAFTPCKTPAKNRRGMAKRPAPLKSLNDESKPGTSDVVRGNEIGRNIRGSLEDCEYSPIRPVRNVITAFAPPFASSTPIITTKRRRISTENESNDIRNWMKSDVEVVVPKKSVIKSKEKCNKIRKLTGAQNAKLSDEKGGIATRLRSRQTVISLSAQCRNEKSSKK